MKLNTNPLKGKYPITVRIAGLCGIFSLILIFLVFPRFVTEAEFGTVDQIVIENIDIPQTQQIDNTPPPARPSIPVPTDDEDIADDVTLDDLDFDDFDAHISVSCAFVKRRPRKLGIGFVFRQITSFKIQNPRSCNVFPKRKIL